MRMNPGTLGQPSFFFQQSHYLQELFSQPKQVNIAQLYRECVFFILFVFGFAESQPSLQSLLPIYLILIKLLFLHKCAMQLERSLEASKYSRIAFVYIGLVHE